MRDSSPLGRILAAGLINRHHSREIMKETIGEVGRQEVALLERYLNTLKDRWVSSDIEEMRRRLLAIARLRYLTP